MDLGGGLRLQGSGSDNHGAERQTHGHGNRDLRASAAICPNFAARPLLPARVAGQMWWNDLRLCNKCGENAYLGEGVCGNAGCVRLETAENSDKFRGMCQSVCVSP